MRIGELATRAGVGAKTLQFYEHLGLIRPEGRTPAGYRIYSSEQLKRLRFIRASRMPGFSLRDMAQILEVWDRGCRPCDDVVRHMGRKIRDIDRQIEALCQLKRQLEALYATGQAYSPDAGETPARPGRCICDEAAALAYKPQAADTVSQVP
ncbi:MAG: MerR family transcriptional regulator [Bacillota bacterium]